MDKLIGKCLSNRYEIIEKIGSGGMANVYKAKCNILNRFVAVKILKEEYKDQEEFIKRFKTETRAVALLSHPNIVAVYDVGFDDGLPYIVMELIEGITLKQYIEQKKVLTWREVIFFSSQILKALEHAHGRKIVHRDIKPQNIMLLRDGTIKVADFGIARFTLSNTQTMTEMAIGSVHYLSPEQAKGSVSDERSDIYSVGVLMYEMLTGVVPFDAENPVMVAMMHLQKTPKMPHEIVKDVLPGIEAIIMKAMSREPSRRYQNAGEMLKDIEIFKRNPNIIFKYEYDLDDEKRTQLYKSVDVETAQSSSKHMINARRNERTDDQETYTESKKVVYLKIAAVVIGIIIIICMAAFGIGMINNLINTGSISTSDSNEVTVPNLVGVKYSDIQDNKDYKDFVITISDQVNDPNVEAGYITAQDPSPERKVRPGAEIKVTVSLGTKLIAIPDLKNAEYRSAMLDLTNLGLLSARVDQYDDNVTLGYVIKTDPSAATQVAEGSEVTLYVSLGKEVKTITVPNVVGDTLDTAKNKLISAGLVIDQVKQVASDAAKGTVVTQSIAPESQVDEKSEITIEVSLGKTSTYNLLINLPLNPKNFEVTVMQNGKQVYSANHSASEGSLTVPLTGTGSAFVEVYIDDRLHFSNVITFD